MDAASSSFDLYWYDYIVFIIILVLSVLIGIYFGFLTNAKDNDVGSNYLFGGRNIKSLPIAISLVASTSSPEILGLVAEVYKYGACYWLIGFSTIILCVATIYVYLPVFFNLKVNTIYEYLELRFDTRARWVTSTIFTLACALYLSLTIYAPAMAFSAVTGINLHLMVSIVSAICILYTSIGGLKAVVWTDIFQFAVVFVTFLTIAILGIKSEGFSTIWKKAVDSGRLSIFDFDPDPTKRDSFWIMIIGLTLTTMSYTSVDQVYMQKFLSVRTFRESSLALIYYGIGAFIMTTICVVIGLTMYAKYADCYPFNSLSAMERNDQILPYYVMDMGQTVPGLTGFFIAAIFSSSLSAQSAILNCLACTIYSDFVSKFFHISDRKSKIVLQLTVVVIGVVCTSFIFVIKDLGNILSLFISIVGVTCGPILGIFTLGLVFPRVNSKGAFYGTLVGICVILCLVIPTAYYESKGLILHPSKPLALRTCLLANETVLNLQNVSLSETTERNEDLKSSNNITNFPMPSQPHFLFRISFYYYTFIGFFFTTISGLLISYLTNRDDVQVDRRFISPVSQWWFLKEPKTVSPDNSPNETELFLELDNNEETSTSIIKDAAL